MTEIRVAPGGTPKWTRDAALNDSDKSFTVPAGKVWRPLSIYGEITTTATVGNRVLGVQITDGTNGIFSSIATGNITASQKGNILVSCNTPTGTTIRRFLDTTGPNASANDALPEMYLPAGYVIRILDIGAVDAAADDLTVVLHYIEYEA